MTDKNLYGYIITPEGLEVGQKFHVYELNSDLIEIKLGNRKAGNKPVELQATKNKIIPNKFNAFLFIVVFQKP